jgi:hypothetical protein
LSGGSAYGIPKNWLIVLLSTVTVFPSTKPELVLTLTLFDSKHNEIPKVNTNNINLIIIFMGTLYKKIDNFSRLKIEEKIIQ